MTGLAFATHHWSKVWMYQNIAIVCHNKRITVNTKLRENIN